MEINNDKIREPFPVSSEISKSDERKAPPKVRVTFHIGAEEKDLERCNKENETLSPNGIDDDGSKQLETGSKDSFKRKVSVLMQDNDSYNELVKKLCKDDDDVNKDFGSVAKHLLKKSSIYAVSQVGHAESPHRKILWILVLSAGLFGCCYEIYHFLTLYFQYPVVINLNVENNHYLEFPAVTICNLNRIKNEYEACMVHNTSVTDCLHPPPLVGSRKKIIISERRSVASCSDQLSGVKDVDFNERMTFLTKYSQLDFEKRKAFGHQIEDLIDSCSFNGVPCYLDNFSYFQNLKYGNCFIFNKRFNDNATVLKTSSVGFINGLDLILNLDPENYVPSSSSVGARVIIHHPQEDPNPQEEGVNISPGYETTLAMKQKCVSRLPAPYKDRCISYGENDAVRGHNQNECIISCIQEQNYDRCFCIDPTLPSFKDYKYCNMTDLEEACCLDSALKFMDIEGLPCECPLSCFSTTYDLRISTAVWPSRSNYLQTYGDWSADENKLQVIREKKSRLRIYYSSLERTIYEQKAMFQDSELFSHLGGQLGLWLGLSIVAAFELIENIMYIGKYCAKLISSSKSG